jgi:hypothetical protein
LISLVANENQGFAVLITCICSRLILQMIIDLCSFCLLLHVISLRGKLAQSAVAQEVIQRWGFLEIQGFLKFGLVLVVHVASEKFDFITIL